MSNLSEAIEKQKRNLIHTLIKKGVNFSYNEFYEKNIGELVYEYQKLSIDEVK
ncbi:hypothetical protein [Aquibacillus rhizosphaerae]|uniref:Fur-regulated basic protein FbpA n=1 Tax=Aquibacillus rhizosphaerae TaxID=3051431 RepID=A0ABT7L752_9BACI|nr:hypothetical protein [Aquibacillus sp. LR5S19]MDL4841042.1 hypothetical protein [Aquibacillus sp. LR5S19]